MPKRRAAAAWGDYWVTVSADGRQVVHERRGAITVAQAAGEVLRLVGIQLETTRARHVRGEARRLRAQTATMIYEVSR